MVLFTELENPSIKVEIDASGRFIMTGPNNYYKNCRTYAEVLEQHKKLKAHKKYRTAISFWCFGEAPMQKGVVTGVHASTGELLYKAAKDKDEADCVTGHVTVSEPSPEDVAEYNRLVEAAAQARQELRDWRINNAKRLGFREYYTVSEPSPEDVAEYNRLVEAAAQARQELRDWRINNAKRLGFREYYTVRRELEDLIKKEAAEALNASIKAEENACD